MTIRSIAASNPRGNATTSNPISETRRLMAGRESEIVAALGIPMPRRGHIKCPTPHHADRNPSFRVDLSRGTYFCTCGSGDLLDLVQAMGAAHDVVSAARWTRDILGLDPIGRRQPETYAQAAERERRTAEALARAEATAKQRDIERAAEARAQRLKACHMWARRKPATGGIVEAYLRGRGITCPLPGTIGFLPAGRPGHHPAMISAFGIPGETADGELFLTPTRLHGVHLTLLKGDGSGKAQVDYPKLTIGLDHGMPIALAPQGDAGPLIIAEGIEDALTAHQLTGACAWAAGTANRLPGLAKHIAGHVETATILVDSDDAGRRYSRRLEEAIQTRGIAARRIETPHGRSGRRDINDVLREEGAGAARRLLCDQQHGDTVGETGQ